MDRSYKVSKLLFCCICCLKSCERSMATCGCAALSVSGLCLVYNIALTAFRASTFEVFNVSETVARTVSMLFINLAAYSLSKTDNPRAQALQWVLVGGAAYLTHLDRIKNVVGKVPRPISLGGKVYIITGSNTGIGFETAKALLLQGATVILACRSVDKATEARNELLKCTHCPTTSVIVLRLDLCSFASVREFVKAFRALNLPLHALINNAGIMMDKREVIKGTDLETCITANHFSHFLLTNLLLPDLEKTAGRVVTLSSSIHRLARTFNFDDIMTTKNYEMFANYGQSKLANILFTRELHKRLTARGSRVSVYAVHPGAVRTDVTRHMNAFMQTGNAICAPILRTMQKTPPEGAYCSVIVATSPELPLYPRKYGGQLFFHGEVVPVSAAGQDDAAAARLWAVSEQITGMVQQK